MTRDEYINVIVRLYSKIYDQPTDKDFPEWLKEHSNRIKKLTIMEEWKYYETIHPILAGNQKEIF